MRAGAVLRRIGGNGRSRHARRRRFANDDAARGEVLGIVSNGPHVGIARR